MPSKSYCKKGCMQARIIVVPWNNDAVWHKCPGELKEYKSIANVEVETMYSSQEFFNSLTPLGLPQYSSENQYSNYVLRLNLCSRLRVKVLNNYLIEAKILTVSRTVRIYCAHPDDFNWFTFYFRAINTSEDQSLK